jgi:hypothetical protein
MADDGKSIATTESALAYVVLLPLSLVLPFVRTVWGFIAGRPKFRAAVASTDQSTGYLPPLIYATLGYMTIFATAPLARESLNPVELLPLEAKAHAVLGELSWDAIVTIMLPMLWATVIFSLLLALVSGIDHKVALRICAYTMGSKAFLTLAVQGIGKGIVTGLDRFPNLPPLAMSASQTGIVIIDIGSFVLCVWRYSELVRGTANYRSYLSGKSAFGQSIIVTFIPFFAFQLCWSALVSLAPMGHEDLREALRWWYLGVLIQP